MIYVDYSYQRKDGSTGSGTAKFSNPKKAIRFIYLVNGKKNYSFDGFTSDDPYDTEYIERRI